jgi:predicted permease
VIALAAVIAAAAAGGVGAQRRLGPRAVTFARWLMAFLLWVVLPIVAFFNIAALELTVRVGAGVAFAYVALAVTLGLAYAIGTWVLRLERASVGALMIVSGFANTGFLGLPFVVALLGFSELPNAVAYDALVSGLALVSIGFTVGAAFGTLGETPRARVRSFFTRNPPLYATAAGFLAPDVLAPEWAVDASQVLVLVTVPVGFFAVGVTLGSERRRRDRANPGLAAVATGVGLKIVVAPAVVLTLSVLVIEAPRAYLSQAGMASAVNALVVADAYGLDRGLVAAGIAWSTAIVVAVGLTASLA